jgi:hypothetical protein
VKIAIEFFSASWHLCGKLRPYFHRKSNLHFVGIGGTAMASIAVAMKEKVPQARLVRRNGRTCLVTDHSLTNDDVQKPWLTSHEATVGRFNAHRPDLA